MPKDRSPQVVGIDAHISTCDIGIADPDGQVTYANRVTTSAKNLIDEIKSLPGKKIVVVEEGCLTSWLIRTLKSYCEKVISSDPKRNSWIARDAYKNDHVDAVKLSQLYQGGFIKEIYHPEEAEREAFKRTVLFYHDLVKMRTRVKNKIKACFRQNGIQCKGKTVYAPGKQEKWLNRLDETSQTRWRVSLLLDQLAVVEKHIQTTKHQLRKMSRPYPEIARFMKIAGIKFIKACTISAIIDTPFRPALRDYGPMLGLG